MPGYSGTGQSQLLRENRQAFLWQNEAVTVNETSVAVALERVRAVSYPWGFAIEVGFSGDPGTFEVDVMGAERDQLASFVKIGTISVVNASFVGRFETTALYPKYVALFMKTLTNTSVLTTGIITR